jgi:hypothetical protein
LEMACDVRTDDFPWTSKLILVDEAAQATEPMTIQYRMHPSICSWPSQEFYGGVHSTASGHRPHADTHVVLIGDHMQRAPTVLSKAAVLGGTAASSWGGPKDGDDEDSTFLEDEERDILRGERSSTASGHRPHRHRLATPPPEAPGPAAPAATGRAAPRAREKAGDVVESTGGIFWAMPVTIKDGDDEDSTFLEDEERDILRGERSSTASGHRPHSHRLATPPPEAPGPAAPAATGQAAPRRPSKIIDSRFDKRRCDRAICCDGCRYWYRGNAVGAFCHTRGMPTTLFRRAAWERGEWDATWYCIECEQGRR